MTEKRSTKQIPKENEILEKMCISLNANDDGAMSKLVESAFDVGYIVERIKKVICNCMARPNFDVICEFCRTIRFEKNRRRVKNG